MNLPDLNDLQFFASVVEHGGYAAAERALGIPQSRLSRLAPVVSGALERRLRYRDRILPLMDRSARNRYDRKIRADHLLFTPARPGAVLAEAASRGLPVG